MGKIKDVIQSFSDKEAILAFLKGQSEEIKECKDECKGKEVCKDKKVIIDYILQFTNIDIVKIIFEHENMNDALKNFGLANTFYYLVSNNNLECFKFYFEKLIKLGVINNIPDKNGTFLHRLYRNYNLEIIKFVFEYFLENHKDLFYTNDVYGRTPFSKFMFDHNIEIIKYVMEFHIKLDTNIIKEKNNFGKTFIEEVNNQFYNLQGYDFNIIKYMKNRLAYILPELIHEDLYPLFGADTGPLLYLQKEFPVNEDAQELQETFKCLI